MMQKEPQDQDVDLLVDSFFDSTHDHLVLVSTPSWKTIHVRLVYSDLFLDSPSPCMGSLLQQPGLGL